MAFVVAGKVLVAPEVEAVIESGRLQVSCGSVAKPCYDAMGTLLQQSDLRPARADP